MSLSILSASAGSGKTYRLSREFVYLCLNADQPAYSTSLLAMTFTNKATAEMKERILKLLSDISCRKIDLDEGDTLYPLFQRLGDDELVNRASNVLRYLLKHYHHFSISTIDSFFQSIIRQFQRELRLDQPTQVELNTGRVLRESIFALLESLQPDDTVFKWILDWISDNLNQGQSWDVRKSLLDLGNELFKEGVTSRWNEPDLNEMQESLQQMRHFIQEKDRQFDEIKLKLSETIASVNLTSGDFAYGKGGFVGSWLNTGEFILMRDKKRFINAEDTNTWFTNSNHAQYMNQVSPVIPEILSLRDQVMDMLAVDMPRYISYKAVIQNFRTYIALRFLYQALIDYCRDNDLMLLSEANKMVAKVVQGTDTSLLYEKSGQRYRHIMVDEFQDTSEAQWTNLKPLFEHVLSNDWKALIVGDVKQAIYRWRNGNWQIMHSGIYNDLFMFNEMIQSEQLITNWRSTSSIISFNNQLFTNIIKTVKESVLTEYESHSLYQSLDTIYHDIIQEVGLESSSVGSVEISVLADQSDEDQTEDSEEATDISVEGIWLKDKLIQLFDGGYTAGDICVLVRTHKEASEMISMLHELEIADGNRGRFEAMSENGFLLRYNPAVQLLLHGLYIRNNPVNLSLIPNWLQLWQRVHPEKRTSGIPDKKAGAFAKPDELKIIWQTSMDTLTGWFTRLIKGWNLEDISPYYVSSFLDFVREYELKEGADPVLFELYWKDHAEKAGVSSDEKEDAIQVMTIHKSKGLQFRVVLIPFTNTKIIDTKNRELIYVEDRNDPVLAGLGIVPVAINKELEHSFFKEENDAEYIMKAIDSLNLLYVALTRPEQRLFLAFKPKNSKNGKEKVSDIGSLIMKSMPVSFDMPAPDVYRWGDLTHDLIVSDTEKYLPGNIPLQALHIRSESLRTGAWMQRQLPVSDTIDQPAEGFTVDSRNYGILIHDILENLVSSDNLSVVLNEKLEEGLFLRENLPSIKETLEHFLAIPEVKDWFLPGLDIIIEKEIIDVDGAAYRPDRIILKNNETVLIDFKTGKSSPAHHKQMTKYINLLQEMGLPPVSGWLAYVDKREIVPVIQQK